MIADRPAKSLEILLVEDNAGDVFLTREILDEAGVPNHLSVARDGVEAMEFLGRRGGQAGAPRPDLILLDLNLPRKDGREVLAEIKGSPDLRRIPVVVLTTSRAEADVSICYDLHANCYLVKPVGLAEFVGLVRSIESFWLTLVTLPQNQGSLVSSSKSF